MPSSSPFLTLLLLFLAFLADCVAFLSAATMRRRSSSAKADAVYEPRRMSMAPTLGSKTPCRCKRRQVRAAQSLTTVVPANCVLGQIPTACRSRPRYCFVWHHVNTSPAKPCQSIVPKWVWWPQKQQVEWCLWPHTAFHLLSLLANRTSSPSLEGRSDAA